MAAIIREQVIEEREHRNQRAAQEHLRMIDAVINRALVGRPDAAACLRQEAGLKLDAMLKSGRTIEPPSFAARADDPVRSRDAATSRTKTPKRAPPDRER